MARFHSVMPALGRSKRDPVPSSFTGLRTPEFQQMQQKCAIYILVPGCTKNERPARSGISAQDFGLAAAPALGLHAARSASLFLT
jgi:hypothetical protein